MGGFHCWPSYLDRASLKRRYKRTHDLNMFWGTQDLEEKREMIVVVTIVLGFVLLSFCFIFWLFWFYFCRLRKFKTEVWRQWRVLKLIKESLTQSGHCMCWATSSLGLLMVWHRSLSTAGCGSVVWSVIPTRNGCGLNSRSGCMPRT